MKNIAILGSSGSVGLNTLRIVKAHPDKFRVRALAVGRNAKVLVEQARIFRPEVVCIYDSGRAQEVEKKLKPLRIRVVTGDDGLRVVSTLTSVDQVIVAIVGAVGLAPIFDAIKRGKTLGIANKEPLVIAGQLLMKMAKRYRASVLPIDSETPCITIG